MTYVTVTASRYYAELQKLTVTYAAENDDTIIFKMKVVSKSTSFDS